MPPVPLPLALASLAAALSGFLFGFDTGAVAAARPFFAHDFALSLQAQGWVVAAVPLGAMAGAALASFRTIGRRQALLAGTLLFFLGSGLSSLAPETFALWMGRLLLGLGVGTITVAAPVYLAEIAPFARRGLFVSSFQLAITLGIVFGQALGYALAPQWRALLGSGAVFAAMAFLGVFLSPESPRFLLSQGKTKEARGALSRLAQESAWADMEKGEDSHAGRQMGLWAICKELRAPLILALGLAILQQLSGINAVLYYAPSILEKAGFAKNAPLAGAIFVGGVNFLATFPSLVLTDRWGRRPLLLFGFAGTALCLFVLFAIFFWGGASPLWTLAVILGYILFFAVSLGPGFWLVASEIFPLFARPRAMALATIANWATNTGVSFSFLPLLATLGASGIFLLYGVFCAAGLIFIARALPETKGRPLEAIEALWLKKV